MKYSLTGTLSGLLGVDIKERGVNALLLCPFHEERTPSFSIHLEDGFWHCFGCGKKGGLHTLYKYFGETMSQDLYHDRLMRGIDSKPERAKNFFHLAMRQVSDMESAEAKKAVSSYISARPIHPDAMSVFGVGWESGKRAISFPYWDEDVVSGIKYRLSDGGKRAEEGSSFGLYSVHLARGRRSVIICEGESDTQSAWSQVMNSPKIGVVGLSGAIHDKRTWEKWSIDFIFASRIYLALDADETGDKGSQNAIDVLGERKCIRLRPTKGKDISEHIKNGGSLVELGLEEEDLGI